MRLIHVALVAVIALVIPGLSSCESTTLKEKKRPPLPGEEQSDLSWSRPTGPNDVVSPLGLPMSR
ncbi:MAG TPA: hypothetical protein VG796_13990 [Verrucomicrobiales bacterium]|jgi:hypothetical protein|nr:hypothetical protein [Verrucomicrobiales bacterium]